MTELHEGLFANQEEAKRATISGRPILSYSRKMLASYILWMDDEFERTERKYDDGGLSREKVAVQETE